ncbi:unnamed protein product, partial [Allacma fusca]
NRPSPNFADRICENYPNLESGISIIFGEYLTNFG